MEIFLSIITPSTFLRCIMLSYDIIIVLLMPHAYHHQWCIVLIISPGLEFGQFEGKASWP